MTSTAKHNLRDLGTILLIPGILTVPAAVVAIIAREMYALPALAPTALLSFGIGGILAYRYRSHQQERSTPTLPTMALAWLLGSVMVALPFLLLAHAPVALSPTMLAFADPLNAWFEGMSGLTSTGLTVAQDPSTLPRTLQWWRSTLEWVGGIGVMFLALAIIGPREDQYARHGAVLDAEMSTRVLPSETENVPRTVWLIYIGYTLITIAAFVVAGMPWWEAINHGLTGISTGGFTIVEGSFQQYDAAIQLVAILVMLMGAVSFGTHYLLLTQGSWKGDRKERQQHVLFALLLVLGTFAVWWLIRSFAGAAFMTALFQATSALGTCGFFTADLSHWPNANWGRQSSQPILTTPST